MIPAKQTPEERRAGWTDYKRRRNWARLSILLVAAALYVLRKLFAPLLVKMVSLSWISYAAITLLFVGAVITVIGLPMSWWMAWKCPACGNKFALNSTADHGLFMLANTILWKLVVSTTRCGFCGKSAKG
jgi:hypothetical protein